MKKGTLSRKYWTTGAELPDHKDKVVVETAKRIHDAVSGTMKMYGGIAENGQPLLVTAYVSNSDGGMVIGGLTGNESLNLIIGLIKRHVPKEVRLLAIEAVTQQLLDDGELPTPPKAEAEGKLSIQKQS
jgi:hypothetical protein